MKKGDDRPDDGADDAGRLERPFVQVLVEQEVPEEATEWKDPTMPSTIVPKTPIGSRPGTSALARKPAIKPMMIIEID